MVGLRVNPIRDEILRAGEPLFRPFAPRNLTAKGHLVQRCRRSSSFLRLFGFVHYFFILKHGPRLLNRLFIQ